ncbi:MAG: restriction endonuclease [Gammaproteobacteria bacterium HGW-Gammaproteobacteria-4]|jgi:putative restriction endonuclease|nr:MAG: restriction endonuclease [Gammaproteobacteria bacterium HGW-Gammaproteobacteria-4]
MAKAIFTFSESSAYDDQPELRYHFPRTYLRQVNQTIDDWVLYYEPRRTSGPSSSSGRQAYFATARVIRVVPDSDRADHYYAYVSDFMEFDRAVAFRKSDRYYESGLVKTDGSTNKGLFGRSVRQIPEKEFQSIIEAGFVREMEPWERTDHLAEPVVEYVVHPTIERLVSTKFREEAFRRHVRRAYDNRCAVTGLRLINGGGRPEVQAAHIRPVEADGPDTVRNGLALTSTVHWLFDRGLISIADDYRILLSPQGLPDDLASLIKPNNQLLVPESSKWRPHPTYLSWHRENRWKR